MFNLEKCPIFMELFPGQSLNHLLIIYFKSMFQALASEIIDKMERDRARWMMITSHLVLFWKAFDS